MIADSAHLQSLDLSSDLLASSKRVTDLLKTHNHRSDSTVMTKDSTKKSNQLNMKSHLLNLPTIPTKQNSQLGSDAISDYLMQWDQNSPTA